MGLTVFRQPGVGEIAMLRLVNLNQLDLGPYHGAVDRIKAQQVKPGIVSCYSQILIEKAPAEGLFISGQKVHVEECNLTNDIDNT